MPGLLRLLMMLCAIAGATGLVASATWCVAQGGAVSAMLLGGALLSCSLMGGAWLGMRRLERWEQANRQREREMGVAASRGVEADGKLKSAFLLLVLAVLVVPVGAGAWIEIVNRQPVPAVAMLVLLFFLLCPASLALRVMVRPGPTLRMDATGIDHALYGRIPWREVLAISPATKLRPLIVHRHLHLSVREPERYLRNAPAPWRWLHRHPIHLVVPLNALDRSAEFIEEAAYALHEAHGDWPKDRWELELEADRREFRSAEGELIAAAGDPGRLAALENRLAGHAEGGGAASPSTRGAP